MYKENGFICSSCKRAGGCDLWNQVSNYEEDWIREAYSYNTDIQSVGVCVTHCGKYQPVPQD